MENNIEMIENMLNTERRNRRGNREIRFEVNSNYYEAVSKLLSDYKRVLKENEELKADNYELNNRINDLLDNIPVQKVKDKIEEYKKMLLSCNRFSDVDRIRAINERILELQELIESEEK